MKPKLIVHQDPSLISDISFAWFLNTPSLRKIQAINITSTNPNAATPNWLMK